MLITLVPAVQSWKWDCDGNDPWCNDTAVVRHIISITFFSVHSYIVNMCVC